MRGFSVLATTILGLLLAGCASQSSSGLQEGWELMVAKEYAAARDQYKSVLEEDPDNPYAHLNLGVAYHRLGQTQRANRQYELAIEHGGSARVTQVAEETGIASRTTTVADQARQNLQSAAGAGAAGTGSAGTASGTTETTETGTPNPAGLNAELERGWELMAAQEFAAARDHYESMLARYPNNPYAHLNLGVAYHRLGEEALAIRHHEAAIAHGGNAYAARGSPLADRQTRSGIQWWREAARSDAGGQTGTTVAELARQNLERVAN